MESSLFGNVAEDVETSLPTLAEILDNSVTARRRRKYAKRRR